MTNIGVKELSVPVSEPSITSSAMQNKNAGSKLPSIPDIKTMNSLFFGIFLRNFMAVGNKTMPEKTILSAATW